MMSLGCSGIWVMQKISLSHVCTHTPTHTYITVKTSSPTKDPHSSALRKGKIFFFDKELFSYWEPGRVCDILLCLAFVLLYEDVWCVWVGICIPITTCASMPWENYACLLPKEKEKKNSKAFMKTWRDTELKWQWRRTVCIVPSALICYIATPCN